MARKYRKKELIHTRLLKDYASWLYCEQCNQTIGYLCYTTYKRFNFTYECKCGNKGSVLIDFDNKKTYESSNKQLVTKKNRLLCPIDESALLTVLQDRLSSYHFDIVCDSCKKLYSEHN